MSKVNITSISQEQTKETFGYKWSRRETYQSESMKESWKNWLYEKYFENDKNGLLKLLDGGKKNILDAGCGSGESALLLFGSELKNHDYLGVDISDSIAVAEKSFSESGIPGKFLKMDLNQLETQDVFFDIIFSEGVLHHTDSVEKSIEVLARKLKMGGKFLFYVYIRKAPIREFTDDFIRNSIQDLTNDQAWEVLMPLTKLGKALGDLNVEIEVEDDIPFLGIKKGKYNIQRLFYYKIAKAFYNKDFSLEELNHINFDWFRPLNCFRHTPEEIHSYVLKAGLKMERFHVEDSGITVIAERIR